MTMEITTMTDPDLGFLSTCSNEELDPLVGYILKAKGTETLSSHEIYKNQKGNHSWYLVKIEEEILRFGGNTFVNLVRGQGVPYREVAFDVATKVGAKPIKENTVEQLEWAILTKLLEKSLDKLTPEEREQIESALNDLGVKGVNMRAGGPAVMAAFQMAIGAGGFAAYQLAVVVANAVAKAVLGRGLTFAANAGLARVMGVFAGPIGWAVTAVWTAIDVAGPAYRVTIPCVVHIAMLRLKHAAREL